jgi:hypothetical protein
VLKVRSCSWPSRPRSGRYLLVLVASCGLRALRFKSILGVGRAGSVRYLSEDILFKRARQRGSGRLV